MLKLPYFEPKSTVGANHLEIVAVGGDQPGAVRPGRERDQDVEMQVTQLIRREAFIGVDSTQHPAGFEPIALRGCQYGMVLLQRSQELPLCRFRRTTPQFCQDH